MYETHLIEATQSLSPQIGIWLSRAIRSNWFNIGPGAYDDRPGGTVCPVTAAGIMAGIWGDGKPLPGNSEWGTETEPSPEVEDFAAYFDLCAKELGTAEAVHIVGQVVAEIELAPSDTFELKDAS